MNRDIADVTVDVSDMLDIGRAIQFYQTQLSIDESIRIRFMNNGLWCGNLTIIHETDSPTFLCRGTIFQGDHSIILNFISDPDGPIDLPIRSPSGRVWTDEDGEDYVVKSHVTASFYADGLVSTHSSSRSSVKKRVSDLSKRAKQALEQWVIANKLLDLDPQTDVWPQPMPKPVRSSSGPKKKKPTQRRAKLGVHKRDRATGETFAVLEVP